MKPLILILVVCPFFSLWGQKHCDEDELIDRMPMFPGGEDALMDYCYNNLDFPENAIINQIEGTTLVHFVIDTTGEILDNTVKIVKSINAECDEAVVRFIRDLPPWEPAYDSQLKKHVSMPYNLPIFFSTTNWMPKHWGKYYMYKAQKAFQDKRWKKGLEQIGLAIKHEPENPIYYILKARMFLQQNRFSKSCVEYQKAKRLNNNITDYALEKSCH